MSKAMKKLRGSVFSRADGACECCGKFITEESGRLDHFFGRAKVPEAVSNCWALCLTCDVAKTANEPTAAFWLVAFIAHARRYCFDAEQARAEAKLLTLHAKALVPA